MLLENQPFPRDVRVRQEAEALTSGGHHVTVVAPRASGEARREVVKGIHVWRYWLPPARDTRAGFLVEYTLAHLQLLVRAALELVRGATVLHVHNPPDTLFVVSLLARLLGRRVIFDNHDLFPELYEDKFGSSSLLPVLRIAQRLSFNSASRVLVTNESQRQVALRSGVLPPSVYVVRNGPPRAMLARHEARRAGALEDPALVFVGELETQDGVLALPAILELLVYRPQTASASLTLVGDGSLRPELERRFADRGLSQRVRFTGRVPHAEVPSLLAEADICIDPAPCSPLNQRSTMIKVAEYLACGRPVVAHDLLETRRTAGDAALYARCGDEGAFAGLVARLAAEPGLRQRLAGRATARAQLLVWERSVPALLAAYDGL